MGYRPWGHKESDTTDHTCTQSNWKAARFPSRSGGQEGWVFVRICRDGLTPGGSVLTAVAQCGGHGAVLSPQWTGSSPSPPKDLRPRGRGSVHLAAAWLPFLPRSGSAWNALSQSLYFNPCLLRGYV